VGQVERRGIAGVCEKNGRIFAIDDFHREEKICQRLKDSLQKGGIPIEEEKIEKGYASVKVEKGCEEKALFCAYQTLIEEENNKRI
jgi:tRNA A37 methylthiotransferase MiaB